jgi:hypothetical protein
LKKRVNKRLYILAKWSDSSAEERQAEFRHRQSGRSFTMINRATSYPPIPSQYSIPTIGGTMRPPAALHGGLSLGTMIGMPHPVGGGIAAMTIGGAAIPTPVKTSYSVPPATTITSTPVPPKIVENPITPSVSQATLASNDSNPAN